ncbi:class I SAM-dependent methyltransferase [Granulicoccus phenolivorans]|uniref:class I SAM-dependent methyltransferase n=1 Tax=Granulicoccus phenolivorans TaxID=266854 RepID=UPI00041EEDA5|nr:class I SAM-dependent methyltransferase [Granulicoccus phenolivorans]
MSNRYTHGHHESVLRSHRRRTAENSAGYLVPHLSGDQDLLDVGCGPGTITVDLAARVRRVTALEVSEPALQLARETATAAGVANIDFAIGDAQHLDLPDACFDVVHAHQVLQHLADPVAALREMIRVTRPGGLVAVRDADYHGFIWYPAVPGLDRWLELYQEVARANHAEPDAGRHLYAWALAAVGDASTGSAAEVIPSASAWCFATEADRSWWSESWAARATESDFAEQAREAGHPDTELAAIAAAWREWGASPGGWLLIPHGEVLIRTQ